MGRRGPYGVVGVALAVFFAVVMPSLWGPSWGQPIVKFNCVERQPVAASVQLGVIGRADRVVFELDGELAGQTTERRVNPRTGQREFWITLRDLTPGAHVVEATAYEGEPTTSTTTSVEIFCGDHAGGGWTLIENQQVRGNRTFNQGGTLYSYLEDANYTWYRGCDVDLSSFVQTLGDGRVRVFEDCAFHGLSMEGPNGRTTWTRDRAALGNRTYVLDSTMNSVYFALPNVELASNVTISGVSADVLMNAVAATGLDVENVNYDVGAHHPDGAQRFVSTAGTVYPLFIWQDSEIRGARSMQGMYTDQSPRPAEYWNCYVSNVRIQNDGVGFTQFHQLNRNTEYTGCVWVGSPFAFKNLRSPAPFVADGFRFTTCVVDGFAYDDTANHSTWGLPPDAGIELVGVAVIDDEKRAALVAQGYEVYAPVAGDTFPYAATLEMLRGLTDPDEPVYDALVDVTTQNAAEGNPYYGVPDGRVTAIDLQYFQNLWHAGDARADLTTQGAGEGEAGWMQPDGRVTGADLQVFVNRWQAANGAQAPTSGDTP